MAKDKDRIQLPNAASGSTAMLKPVTSGFDQKRFRQQQTRVTPTDVAAIAFAIIWFIITFFPIWWVFNIVFSQSAGAGVTNPYLYPNSIAAGLTKIGRVFTETDFLHAYLVSTGYAVLLVSGTLVVVSMAAYEFAFFKFRGRNILFVIALASMMIPFAVIAIPLTRIVVALKMSNSLQGLAVPSMASAFGLFVMRQFMETLPREIMDAAKVDGASHFGVYWRIVLPLSKNALVTLSVLTFMAAWGNYLWPLLINTNPNWFTVSVTVAGFFHIQAWVTVDIVMAVSLLAAIPPLLVYLVFQQYIVQSIALTGLKGS